MFHIRVLTLGAVALLLPGVAWAQQPLAGEFLELESGVLFRFTENADGSLSGEMAGSTGNLPLALETDGEVLQAWFEVEGQYAGLYGELTDPDTLSLWLYFIDEAGQPLPGTEEQAVAVRQDAHAEEPDMPSFSPPPMPRFSPEGYEDSTTADITGAWTAVLEPTPGVSLHLELYLDTDGSFRHEISDAAGDYIVAWEAGSFTVAASGLLQMSPVEGSEEMCFGGECEPYDLEASSYRTELLPTGELQLSETGNESGVFAEVTYAPLQGTAEEPGAGTPAEPAPLPDAPAPAPPAPGQTLPPPPVF